MRALPQYISAGLSYKIAGLEYFRAAQKYIKEELEYKRAGRDKFESMVGVKKSRSVEVHERRTGVNKKMCRVHERSS